MFHGVDHNTYGAFTPRKHNQLLFEKNNKNIKNTFSSPSSSLPPSAFKPQQSTKTPMSSSRKSFSTASTSLTPASAIKSSNGSVIKTYKYVFGNNDTNQSVYSLSDQDTAPMTPKSKQSSKGRRSNSEEEFEEETHSFSNANYNNNNHDHEEGRRRQTLSSSSRKRRSKKHHYHHQIQSDNEEDNKNESIPSIEEMKRLKKERMHSENIERGYVALVNTIIKPQNKLSVPDNDSLDGDRSISFAIIENKKNEMIINKQACEIFNNVTKMKCYDILQHDIDNGKILFRSGRNPFLDIGLQLDIISIIQSYNVVWLKLGLEMIFGNEIVNHYKNQVYEREFAERNQSDIIDVEERDKIERKYLSQIIKNCLMSDEGIKRKYGKSKEGAFENNHTYLFELQKHFLFNFLILVMFLDLARMEGIHSFPLCLFDTSKDFNTMNIKSSFSVLQSFARLCSIESDVLPYLKRIGYVLQFIQNPIEEYDFNIHKIQSDLRNGIIIAKLVECLDPSLKICDKLYIPCTTKYQQVFNIEELLIELGEHISISTTKGDITCLDIVDGNKSKTLSLLWKAISHWMLPKLIDVELIQSDINKVSKHHGKLASGIYTISQDISNRNDDNVFNNTFDNSIDDDFVSTSENMLLRWCQCICSLFNAPVVNFTHSMASGRVLCFLIHYYHPELIKKSEIKIGTDKYLYPNIIYNNRDMRTDDEILSDAYIVATSQSEMSFHHITTVYPSLSFLDYSSALEEERMNFALLNRACQSLGCIPQLLPSFDSENAPEKSLCVMFLAYLWNRIFIIDGEVQAAKCIQKCWAKYIIKIKSNDSKVYIKAQSILSSLSYEQFKEKMDIEKARREKGRLADFFKNNNSNIPYAPEIQVKRKLELSKIDVIKPTIKSHSPMKQFHDKEAKNLKNDNQRSEIGLIRRRSAIIIQKNYRGFKAREDLRQKKIGAKIIQRWLRGVWNEKDEILARDKAQREEFLSKISGNISKNLKENPPNLSDLEDLLQSNGNDGPSISQHLAYGGTFAELVDIIYSCLNKADSRPLEFHGLIKRSLQIIVTLLKGFVSDMKSEDEREALHYFAITEVVMIDVLQLTRESVNVFLEAIEMLSDVLVMKSKLDVIKANISKCILSRSSQERLKLLLSIMILQVEGIKKIQNITNEMMDDYEICNKCKVLLEEICNSYCKADESEP